MTDADKAKAVWIAAFPRARAAPSPDLLDALARDLGRAAAWAKMARQPRPTDERKNLQKIEGAARRLLEYLAEFSETHDRLEHDWPPESVDSGVAQVTQGIASLQRAAVVALLHRRGSAVLEEKFGSAGRLLVRRCVAAYEKHTGKRAGIARIATADPNEIGGPFVRFTQEAARQFAVSVPDGETIRRALGNLRSTGGALTD